VVWVGLLDGPTATTTRQPTGNLLQVSQVELDRTTLGLLLLRNDVGHSLVLLWRNCFFHEDSFWFSLCDRVRTVTLQQRPQPNDTVSSYRVGLQATAVIKLSLRWAGSRWRKMRQSMDQAEAQCLEDSCMFAHTT
jgi:hypothetical protein